MSSTQHQLIEQCATRLRGIVEALDNIHDSTPHRWSTDLDDVHSSAESLLAMIKDQAPTQAAQGLAGAALAQPSPAQAEQAEAERPEMSPERAAYFMRRFKPEEKLLGPNEQAAVDYVLSLLAQHDRIVGELRDELEAERKRVNIYVNNNRIRQDNERLRAELRDALARVAGLELGIARIAGDFLPDNSGQAELALDEMRQALHELLAAAPTQAQHSVPDHAELLQALERTHAGHMVGHDQSDQPKGGYSDGYVNGFGECIKVARKVLAAAPGKEVPQAWLDVQAERRRQVEAEGWTPEHDDLYCAAELPRAAAAYILNGANDEAPAIWPFVAKWWKPRDARSNYVRAGALILAEIERLDRAGISQSPQPGATTASS